MSKENPTTLDVYNVLKSIDASLQHLVSFAEARSQRSAASNGPAIADDADLDSDWGDEKIRFTPRDWSAENFVGRTMSQTSDAFLQQYAAALDYFAKKNDASQAKADNGTLKSVYDKRSASRARGWAKRLASGWKPKAVAPPADSSFGTDDNIAF